MAGLTERIYDNESIKSLKGAERVRKRPGVIFGSDGLEGCEHSFFEILSKTVLKGDFIRMLQQRGLTSLLAVILFYLGVAGFVIAGCISIIKAWLKLKRFLRRK